MDPDRGRDARKIRRSCQLGGFGFKKKTNTASYCPFGADGKKAIRLLAPAA